MRPRCVFAQMRVAEPLRVVALRIIDAMVIQPPAAFRAIQRRMRRHFGAIANRSNFSGAHQFVRIVGFDPIDVVGDFRETLQADFHLARDLRRLQIIVHHAAQLVFDLRRRKSCLAFERRIDARALGFDLLIDRAARVRGPPTYCAAFCPANQPYVNAPSM